MRGNSTTYIYQFNYKLGDRLLQSSFKIERNQY